MLQTLRSSRKLLAQRCSSLCFNRRSQHSAQQRGDVLLTYLSSNQEVLLRCINLTHVINKVQTMQKLTPLASEAVGRALICTTLMSAGLKDKAETLQLVVNGNGPLGSIMVVADTQGRCRGRVAHGQKHADCRSLQEGIGAGVLQMVRSSTNNRGSRPYSASVHMRSSDVTADVADYLQQSEQRRCAIATQLTLRDSSSSSHSVCTAAGFLMELLPGVSPESEAALQAAATAAQSAHFWSKNADPAALAATLLRDIGGGALIATCQPTFHCTCSHERMAAAVRLLGDAELHNVVRAGEDLHVTCDFCSTQYSVTPAQVAELLLLQPE
jgi:molecular chaperone Hsp33